MLKLDPPLPNVVGEENLSAEVHTENELEFPHKQTVVENLNENLTLRSITEFGESGLRCLVAFSFSKDREEYTRWLLILFAHFG